MAVSTQVQVFLSILLVYIAKYFPEELDPSLKPYDSANCIECRKVKYDFIIVGAGSAGSVLAHRLSENLNWNILLIEAGADENYFTDIPGLIGTLSNTQVTWNYTTVKQKYACLEQDGVCAYSKGHVMGGSSAINGMLYVRGNPADFDEWEQMGNPGWGFKDIFKYFLKLEHMTIPEFAISSYHSTRGPLIVSYSRYREPIFTDILQAGLDFGLNVVDYNGASQIGVNYAQLTTDGVTRASASKCYLDPIRNRPNLWIFKNTLVTKVLINEATRTAVGVRCLTSGEQYDVFAKKEVILSAGAINSPQLLMLSGIGPKKHLIEKGIHVIADLPVGENLQDHSLIYLPFKQEHFTEECYKQYGTEVAYSYTKYRQGKLTSNTLPVNAFLPNTQDPKLPPNIQFTFVQDNFIVRYAPESCLTIFSTIVDPKSRGTVKLNSSNIFDPPLIDPNHYGAQEDLQVAISAVQQALSYMNAPILSKYGLTLIPSNHCIGIQVETAFLKCIIAYQTATAYHPCGTTRMGSILDKTTVVSHELKVHTIKNLRVVDAGVMPRVTRGNTNVPTIMLAEKAADIIKAAYFNS